MSDIIIEGKNINEIDQSNFQSVGPYVENGSIAVYEPWQGREIDFQGNDTDGRFSLGTITENNRDFWEVQTTNKLTRKSQFSNKRIRTARAKINSDNGLVISDEVKWSVDTFPFNFNNEAESTPLYFYYDEKLHPKEYENASSSTVSFRIELRESGRQNGIMDNFLLREPFRPFIIGTQAESYDSTKEPGGYTYGDGAFNFNDEIELLAEPFGDCHFVRWVDGETEEEISLANPYVFSVPRFDIQLVGKFNSNPIIKFGVKINGVEPNQFPVTNGLGRFLVTDNVSELIDDVSNASTGSEFSYFNYFRTSKYAYDDDETNEVDYQVYRPGTEITVFDYPIGDEYLLQDFSIINQNGEEESIPDFENDVLPDYDRGRKGVYEIPNAVSIFNNSFPDNILKIFANYTILYFYVRSINNWFLTDDANQSLTNKQSFVLTFGYGDGEPTFRASQLSQTPPVVYDSDGIDWFQVPVDSSLNMKIDQLLGDGIPGYDIGEWFWYQTPESGSLFGHLTLENDGQEFDQPILDSLTDDDVGMDDGVSLRISYNDNNPSPVATLITGTADAFTYIGYKFTQLGTYIKITKTDDSHDFDITSPPSTSVIRAKENSPELDANMYGIGSTLIWDFTPNTVHEQGEVGEMPEIESVKGWDDTTKTFQTYPNSEVPSLPSVLSALGITYEQNGESMRLRYPLPDSTEDNLYLKYFEFIVKSTIVPPPIVPFNGIFEINFSNANASVATLSFSQEDGETSQTTLIGQYGEDLNIETPTHAITVDDWINGATVGILPVPLEINYNANVNPNDVTQLPTQVYFTSATANAIDELLEVVQPTNQYNEQTKNMIKENLLGTGNDPYLGLSAFNNSFNIEKLNSNEFIEEFLRGIEQDNSLPRIPITVVSNFTQTFNISIQAINFFALPVGEYPTRFITNWNQAAYDENSTISAANTWIDDDLLLIDESEMFTSDDIVNITIPASFFNGSRVLKIRQVITSDSPASAGPEILQSGGSATITSNESSTYDWTNRITAVEGSVELTISWVGNF